MKQYKSENFTWHFPNSEEHFIQMLQINPEYQIKNKNMILRYKNQLDFSCVLDIGANVGLWTRWFNAIGSQVIHCFEPMPENLECLKVNTQDLSNVTIYPVALFNEQCDLTLYTTVQNKNTGTATIFANEAFTVPHQVSAITLDSLNLAPTFIKIDVQGAELAALQGGEQTIIKHKPAMIVECEDGKTEPLEYLASFGYKVIKHTTVDYLLLADTE